AGALRRVHCVGLLDNPSATQHGRSFPRAGLCGWSRAVHADHSDWGFGVRATFWFLGIGAGSFELRRALSVVFRAPLGVGEPSRETGGKRSGVSRVKASEATKRRADLRSPARTTTPCGETRAAWGPRTGASAPTHYFYCVRRSIFAAMMKSLSERPLILWV